MIAAPAGIEVSVWAIDGVELDAAHPWPNARYVSLEAGPTWTAKPGRYQAAITGTRWLDLWLAAEQVVVACGDEHHRFIEAFDPLDDGTLDLMLGS